MPAAHTRLGASSQALMDLLSSAPDLLGSARDLRRGSALTDLLALLAQRRTMDLSDLSPSEQAALIHARTTELLPSVEELARLLAITDRPLVVKFGIDPTAADVHVGHAVPMLVASRFQRMGHRVVFIVGDITARIGDPSGRTGDRPALTDAEIARNMASYRAQVSPFFDFDRADFRFNSEWLADFTLPRFIGVLERLPLAAALQREEFRRRLAEGGGLTMAELVYSVVMALDSVHIVADIEIGGLDQLLNLAMCRRVMEHAGQQPEVIIATPLIEGTDGTGAKMSKSKGNYVGLAFEPGDVHGGLMSVADRLLPGFLRALTELLDPEIDLLVELMRTRRIHPMGVKTLLAADVTAAIHGPEAATTSRADFTAQFSRKRLAGVADLPVVGAEEFGGSTVAQLFVAVTALVPSLNQVRRVAAGGGLRLVVERPGSPPATVALSASDANITLGATLVTHAHLVAAPAVRTFLKCGRAIIEIHSG